jgi:hypothetical protein
MFVKACEEDYSFSQKEVDKLGEAACSAPRMRSRTEMHIPLESGVRSTLASEHHRRNRLS